MRRERRARKPVGNATGSRKVEKRKPPRRASRFLRSGRGQPPKRGCWSCRIEPLEARFLLSVVPGLFKGDSEAQTAVFDFAFEGTPIVESIDGGVMVSLEGEETWVSTGDPVMPVHESSILLPQGMQIASISASYVDAGMAVASGVELLAAPAAIPFGQSSGSADESIAFVSASFGAADAVEYSNHTVCGYNVGTLRVFPIEYDAIAGTLTYHSRVSVAVTVSAAAGSGIASPRCSAADRQRVLDLVDNPEAIDGYAVPASASDGDSPMLPADGQYEYVIITNTALTSGFQPLVSQKQSRGLSARIVTTEYIYANYSGTETGDAADKIRNFIADAYAHWGTQWVLLGGDVEVVPQRGVYASVGSTVDYSLPTDLYYACLDGPWNRDGDSLWAESNDGAGGGDVDLMSEVYVGRAPVSNLIETANFVSKTIQYETTAHPNATTAVWLGEQLDDQTWGSYSGIPISDQCIPEDWTLVERYDSAGGWSGTDFRNDLNASPNLVNHLGHANETYNARLYNSHVAGLANDFPYFMYSQGCMSGSFDTHDLAIAEQHVVAENGAVGVIMNSRYGWYVPGNTPGASHYYASEFWDAVFNEGLTSPGQANQDSKDDNMFRVGSTGVYRWINFETNLFGDPETPLQTGGSSGGTSGQISGIVWDDVNGDGQRQAGEQALAGQVVFLDLNNNGLLDAGTVTASSADVPAGIPDNATATSALTVSECAAIGDVNVTLDISHTWDSDLQVYLISPSGTKVNLFAGVGGWGENFTNTTLDDEAATSISDANAPFTGTFRPQGRLSRFDGEDPNGTWTLQITDTVAWDQGTLNSWSLEITGEEPHVYSGTDGSYAFTGLAGGTYCVRHELPCGWIHTNPVDGALMVNVQHDEAVTGVDFLASETSQVPPATELGQVDFLEIADLNLANGDCWYSLQTTRQGYLTVEALFQGSAGELGMTLYDANLNELATSAVSDRGERIDWSSGAGEAFYLKVAGNASDVDLRLANLVHHVGGNLVVYGTHADDRLDFAAAALYRVTINGVQYGFQPSSLASVEFNGGAGNDTAVLLGSPGADTAVMHPSWATLVGSGYRVMVANAKNIVTVSRGGQDVAHMYDSAGDDVFIATPDYGILYGDGFFNRAVSFGHVHAFATAGGSDVAKLCDSAGDDVFIGTPDYGILYGDGFSNRAVWFRYVYACASAGGYDRADLYDSAGDDHLEASANMAGLSGDDFFRWAYDFAWMRAISSQGGSDTKHVESVDYLLQTEGPWMDV